MKKKKKEIPLLIPPKQEGVNRWVILGIDPSLTRTGYSVSTVTLDESGQSTVFEWKEIGSVKPEVSSNPVWVRGKALALYLKDVMRKYREQPKYCEQGPTGLIISMEYPTPRNDFLVALNRILHLVFFEDGQFAENFNPIRVLTTNAATLRSLMNLKKTGNNKGENISRAYEFIDRGIYPNLDSDSCDAVLLSMMARHTASILLGVPQEVPERVLTSLCNATQEAKKRGDMIVKIQTKGSLHRPEYWYTYETNNYTVCIRDACGQKGKLERKIFNI